jgi:hypothetical protein
MAVLGRLIVAHLIASCAVAAVIILWGATQFSLRVHWIVDGLFALAAVTIYSYVIYQAYFWAKGKWS